VNNRTAAPVAYTGADPVTPTGWAAWAFAPLSAQGFGRTITRTYQAQAVLTLAGEFRVWDDDNWNIMCQQVGSPPRALVPVNAVPFQGPAIALVVGPDGAPSAYQVNQEEETAEHVPAELPAAR
jgi:hypothetical protein